MSSGGGGGGTKTVQNYNETTVPDWVQAAATQNFTEAQQLAAQPYQPPPMPQLAGFTPDQLATFQAIQQMQGVAPGEVAQSFASVANLPATTASLANPALPGAEATVLSNAMRSLATTQQAIGAQAARQGTLGGTREAVDLSLATSGAEQTIGSNVANLAGTSWMQATTNALNDAALTGRLALAGESTGLAGANALGSIGSTQQTLDQAAIEQALQTWQMGQTWPYQQLAISEAALQGSPYGSTTEATTPYTGSTGMQTAGALIGALPMLLSAAKGLSSFGSTVSALSSGSTTFGDLAANTFSTSAATGLAPLFAPVGVGIGVGSLVGNLTGSTGAGIGSGIGAAALTALLPLLL
jgi:hypothetical protein